MSNYKIYMYLTIIGLLLLWPCMEGAVAEAKLVTQTASESDSVKDMPFAVQKLDRNVLQVILVESDEMSKNQGILSVWQKINDTWNPIGSPVKVTLGRNGFISSAEKREGDGCTPEGMYAIKRAFGYDRLSTKLTYVQLSQDDYWIDDPISFQYNKLVRYRPSASSFERMKRDDDLYKVGFVIEYNTEPIIAGKGSAIFAHIWRGPNSPTAGCIAMDEKNMVNLLKWLDPSQNPVIIIRKIDNIPL